MAKNRRFYPAHHLELPVPSGWVSGDPVIVGGTLPGVCTTDRDAAGNASVAMAGAYLLTLTTPTGAVAIGTAVYGAAGSKVLNDVLTARVLFGHVVEGALNAGVTGQVTVKISTP